MLSVAAAAALGYFAGLGDAWVAGPTREVLLRLVLGPGLITVLGIAALWLNGRRAIWRSLPPVLAAMALAWGPGVGQAIAGREGSATYFYGTRGQREAARELDRVVRADEFYVASKDVAWYAANQRYIDQDTLDYFVRLTAGRFDAELIGYDVRVLALWQQPPALRDHYRQLLSGGYDLVAERGDYGIWVRRIP